MSTVQLIPAVVALLGYLGITGYLKERARKVLDRVIGVVGVGLDPITSSQLTDEQLRDIIARVGAALGVKLDARAIARAVGEMALRAELARLAAAADKLLADHPDWGAPPPPTSGETRVIELPVGPR